MLLRISLSVCLAALVSSVAVAQPTLPSVKRVAAPVGNFFHSGYGVLNNGTLTGQIVSLDETGQPMVQPGAAVVISQGNNTIGETKADEQGTFTVEGLKPGVYEVKATGEVTYGAVAFQAVEGSEQVPMYVYSASMPKSAVEQVVMSMWLPQEAQNRRNEFNTPKLSPYRADSRPTVQTSQVKMNDGAIDIQVAFPHAQQERNGLVATLFRAGDDSLPPLSMPVGMAGDIRFEIGQPGVYNLVIGGAGYYTAVSFEAVGGPAAGLSSATTKGPRFVSKLQGAADTLLVPVITDDISIQNEQTPPEDPPVEDLGPIVDGGFLPPAGGGYGGGGGFGGGAGGGGGIGGLGGIAGLAGLAVGIAAIADDDDGFNINQATGITP